MASRKPARRRPASAGARRACAAAGRSSGGTMKAPETEVMSGSPAAAATYRRLIVERMS